MSAPLRIVVVNRHVTHLVGGSEVQCDLVARGLVEQGHTVRYLAVESRGPVTGTPYEVEPVPLSARAIAAAARAWRPDVLYWRLDRDRFAATAKALARAPFPFVYAVAHIRNLELPVGAGIGPFRPPAPLVVPAAALASAWMRHSFRHVDAIVVNNPDHLGIVRGPRQAHVPNGMDDTAVDFDWPRPYVAWVGSLKPPKRPEAAVALADLLAGYGVDLLMAGDLQHPRYAGIANGTDRPGNVHHLGLLGLHEVNGLLAGSRALVHTCRPEGFSNVMIQAWLQGRPTVSLGFDPGGVIRRHGLGAVCDDDPLAFRAAVANLLERPELVDETGVRARTYARAHHDPGRSTELLASLLADVVAAGRRRT